MPRAVYFMVWVLAHAALPLWPLSIAAVFVWPTRVVVACFGAEGLATTCGLALFMAARADYVRKRTEEAADREQLLILAVDRLSNASTQPLPRLRAFQG